MKTMLENRSFNSIKVQLEQCMLKDVQMLARMFQFHKGSIRTIIASVYAKPGTFGFNSIKVQLELTVASHETACVEFQFHKGSIRTSENEARKAYGTRVSIP